MLTFFRTPCWAKRAWIAVSPGIEPMFRRKLESICRLKKVNTRTLRSVDSVAKRLPSGEKANPVTMVLFLANSYKSNKNHKTN